MTAPKKPILTPKASAESFWLAAPREQFYATAEAYFVAHQLTQTKPSGVTLGCAVKNQTL